jgi:type II secretory pathway pseudopilin PulG
MTLQPKNQKAESENNELRVARYELRANARLLTRNSQLATRNSQTRASSPTASSLCGVPPASLRAPGLRPKFRGVPPASLRAPGLRPKFRGVPPASLRAAFTLIEMITVLTIIIIVLAIAIPVWNALLGGTNLASAQNQISAYLTNARADAIFNRQTIGVCFYIDPKTQQTAVAEVQVQTLWQVHPYSGGTSYTSQFIPGYWTGTLPTPTWAAWPYSGGSTANGPINSLELVNNPDPNNPGNYVFYRDPLILPKGVGVVFNSPTYGYNYQNGWNNNNSTPSWTSVSPVDRYVRLGVIMFNPDGTLAAPSVAFGIPYYEQFTSASQYSYNLLCEKIGMQNDLDLASIATPAAGGTPATLPLTSSPGLIVFDHDVYATQHCSMQVMDFKNNPPTQTTIGDGNPFSDVDLNYTIANPPPAAPTIGGYPAQDKFIEEAWIDKNGTAFLINPTSGALIQAK